MQIKRAGLKEIQVESNGGVNLSVKFSDNKVVVEVKSGEGNKVVSKPGEYEISGIEIFGKELREPMNANISAVFFSVDNIKCLLLLETGEKLYEWLKTLPFIDLLIVTEVGDLKETVTKIDPEKIILVLENGNAEIDLKKVTTLPVVDAKQFKFKDTDFGSLDETAPLEIMKLV